MRVFGDFTSENPGASSKNGWNCWQLLTYLMVVSGCHASYLWDSITRPTPCPRFPNTNGRSNRGTEAERLGFFNTSHFFEGLKNANIIKHCHIRYGNIWHISGSEKKTSPLAKSSSALHPNSPKQGSRQKRISSKCCACGLARSASADQILLA